MRTLEDAGVPVDEMEAPAAVERALAQEDAFEAKSKKAPGRIRRQLEQLRLFMRMLKDVRRGDYKKLPWLTLASFAGAVLYFLNPFDLVPDFLFGIGFLDDATVAALVVKAYQRDLVAYCQARGLDTQFYFGESDKSM